MSASFDLSGLRSVTVIGAHPDDIEIGAGGTLLTLAQAVPGLRVHYVLLGGNELRHAEAREAVTHFLPGASVTMALHGLPDGRLPAHWNTVKEHLHEAAAVLTPDLVLGPSRADAHQDHRLLGELVPTVFRSALALHYEIPKWDGDFSRPNLYVPLSDEVARRKVELLDQCYPSQHAHDWWGEEVFLGLARLRGMECRAHYAEAFTCHKATLRFGEPRADASAGE